MYRIFDPRYIEPVMPAKVFSDLKMTWKKGMHKDTKGVFGVKDMEYQGGYGEPVKDGERLIMAATLHDCIRAELPRYARKSPVTIPVNLRCGITLQIVPATAEPREFLFGAVEQDEQDEPELYNHHTTYGAAAWDLLNSQERATENGEVILQNDKRVVVLAQLALVNSYNLPILVWDAMRILTLDDIDAISAAGMGYSQDFIDAVGKHSATPACGEETAAE